MNPGKLRNAASTWGIVASFILIAIALPSSAPDTVFMLSFLAVTSAVFPLALGTARQRIAAALALLLAMLVAGSMVEKAKEEKLLKLRGKTAPTSPAVTGKQKKPLMLPIKVGVAFVPPENRYQDIPETTKKKIISDKKGKRDQD